MSAIYKEKLRDARTGIIYTQSYACEILEEVGTKSLRIKILGVQRSIRVVRKYNVEQPATVSQDFWWLQN